MRLAQLARKLGVKPADVQVFLTARDQNLELNTNARLTDEQVIVAVRHFDPSQEATVFQEPATSEPVAGPESHQEQQSLNEVAESVAETVEPTVQTAVPISYTTADEVIESEPEVIRAPKVELPGLKVIGKIELRDPKKKSEEPLAEGEPLPEGEASQPQEPKPEREPQRERQSPPVPPSRSTPERGRRQASPRQWKNPLEVQRQREATEREENRRRELELKKEQRTQKYLKKVKSAPTKPVRRREEEVVEMVEDTRPVPKTWLGKFARWLTT